MEGGGVGQVKTAEASTRGIASQKEKEERLRAAPNETEGARVAGDGFLLDQMLGHIAAQGKREDLGYEDVVLLRCELESEGLEPAGPRRLPWMVTDPLRAASPLDEFQQVTDDVAGQSLLTVDEGEGDEVM